MSSTVIHVPIPPNADRVQTDRCFAMQQQESLFVFVTKAGRIMACLSDGTIADVTECCELLPRHVCKEKPATEGKPQLRQAA